MYPSDLSDKEWNTIKHIFANGNRAQHSKRSLVNGVFYLVKTGCQWRMLPREYPPWGTVYWYFATWKKDGTWENIHDTLVKLVRVQQGGKPSNRRYS